jgi:hypothetical protein
VRIEWGEVDLGVQQVGCHANLGVAVAWACVPASVLDVCDWND